MFRSRKIALIAGTLFTLGFATVGLRFVEDHAKEWEQQVPLMKGTIRAAVSMHHFLADASQQAGATLQGFVSQTASSLDSQQKQFLEQHPVLKGSVEAFGKVSQSVAGTSQKVVADTTSLIFPDEAEVARREDAKAKIQALGRVLSDKQQGAQSLNTQIQQLQQQIQTLEKIANPIKRVIPDGFNFLEFHDDASQVDNGQPPVPKSLLDSTSGPKKQDKPVNSQDANKSDECSCP